MPVLPPSLAPEGRYYPKNICRALVGGNCVKYRETLCLAWNYRRICRVHPITAFIKYNDYHL